MSLTVRPRYSVRTAASADVEPRLDVVDDRGLALHLRAVGGCLGGHVVAPRGLGRDASRAARGTRLHAPRNAPHPAGVAPLRRFGPLPRVETGSLRRSVDGGNSSRNRPAAVQSTPPTRHDEFFGRIVDHGESGRDWIGPREPHSRRSETSSSGSRTCSTDWRPGPATRRGDDHDRRRAGARATAARRRSRPRRRDRDRRPPGRSSATRPNGSRSRAATRRCDSSRCSATGRVELEITHGLLWTTMRSYRDGQQIPFRRTRMPWPSLAAPHRTPRGRFRARA